MQSIAIFSGPTRVNRNVPRDLTEPGRTKSGRFRWYEAAPENKGSFTKLEVALPASRSRPGTDYFHIEADNLEAT